MKNTLYRRFLFHCSLLICLNTLLIIFSQLGIGTLNSECGFIDSDNLLVSMVFSAVDLMVIFVDILTVLGIVNFIFFSILVNEKILRDLGLNAVLLSTITISLLSYFILCIPDFEPEIFWFVISLKSAFLFSVLPAVTAVCIKYVLWKMRKKDG